MKTSVEHKRHRQTLVRILSIKSIVDTFQFVVSFIRPLFDFVLRFYLAQIFFISSIIKLSDWDKAIYLSQHEYPVPWMDPVVAAYFGVGITLVGSVLLFLGLFTRIAAFALMILTMVIQIYYEQLNTQTIWIILLGWFVIFGADKLSLDHAMRGVKDSALFFSRTISIIYTELTRFVGPFYQLGIRFWIACVWVTAAWLLWKSAGQYPSYPYPVLGYQYSGSLLTLLTSAYAPIILAVSGVMIGLGLFTRIIALLGIAGLILWLPVRGIIFQAHQMGEVTVWLFILGLVLLWGPGTFSLDNWIRRKYNRMIHHRLYHASKNTQHLPHVVIIGGGFGGVAAAKMLKTTACRITLIDRHNYHLFQPLLYQVATAGLSPAEIAAPIRSLFVNQPNIQIKLAEVIGIDKAHQKVNIKNDTPVSYDYLILATGAQHSYFGQDQWSQYAPGLKKVEDAISIRQKVLTSFELAENTTDKTLLDALLTVVIVGGGPTGIELAGAFAELAHQGMENEFRHIDPTKAKIILVEAGPRLLSTMPEKLSQFTQRALEHLGVIVKLNTRVEKIDHNGIVANGELIPSRNVFWAAGVQGSKAARWLNIEPDKAGRILVNSDLSVPGWDNVYAIGDTISVKAWNDAPVPGLAPAAKQSGKYVAELIRSHIEGKPITKPFQYKHYGSLATIGRSLAVIDFGPFTLSGPLAWWFWGGSICIF